MYNKRRVLRNKTDIESIEELELREDEMAKKYFNSMANKIREELKGVNWENGGFNPGKFWKLDKKVSPRICDAPTAMKDAEGNLLTTEEEIKAETVRHYKGVFKDPPIDEHLKSYRLDREKLCEQRLDEAAQNKTPPWTDADVRLAAKDLITGIYKDPHGHLNDIFKYGLAGEGLIKAVTKLMNKLKDNTKEYPEVMNICIYKKKGI